MLKRITLKGEQKKVLFLPSKNPIQIKGVAGSGKTTVALYRAKHLLETERNLFSDTNIVIFTYNRTLAEYIEAVRPYISGGYQKDSNEIKPRSPDGLNIKVINFHRWAYSFIERNGVSLRYETFENGFKETVWKTINEREQTNIIEDVKRKFFVKDFSSKPTKFFQEEIKWMKGKMFKTKDEYLEAKRVGRGTSDRVTMEAKEVIWDIYTEYGKELKSRDKVDFDDYALLALNIIEKSNNFIPPFSHIIVDEAQDLNKAQILTLSKLVSNDTNSLTIIADAAQRIYKSGFNWNEVGINVRGGRTVEFKKNYRNSIHIANAALSLLENETDKSDFTDVETAINRGDKPKIGYFEDRDDQFEYILGELAELKKSDSLKSTVILHRTNTGVNEVKSFLENKGYGTEYVRANQKVNYDSESIKICTMSSIKGLEFANVFIIDLNDDILPLPTGFADSDDEFHKSTERRLLYTAMTRAENKLYLLSCDEPSVFLEEIEESLLVDITNDFYSNNNTGKTNRVSDFDDFNNVDDLPF